MPLTIPIAHDFICPWCWIGLFQAKDLKADFGVELEWRSFEILPESMPWGDYSPKAPDNPRRPSTPSRLDLAYVAQGISKPTAVRPKQMRSHNAHEAVEFAKERGVADEVVETLYRAYWERGQDISDVDVLGRLLADFVDVQTMQEAVTARRCADRIIPFDEVAYASGVFYVPTFFIGDEELAEQPYREIRAAMERLLVTR